MSLYRPLIEYFDREVKDMPGISADEVAQVIANALTAEKPKAHYQIGPGVKKMKNLAKFPPSIRDKMFYKAIYK